MRFVIAILGLLIVVGALAGVKGCQIATLMAAGKELERAGPPPESVSTARAEERGWEGSLSAVGSITAVKGVLLSNEAPGAVTRIRFESGARVREGDVLVELDAKVERAQLDSARARQSLAATQLDRSRKLVESRSIAPAQLDADQSALDAASADVRAIEGQIARKVVRAPFSGMLGIRAVNLGQYLNVGSTITVLETIDPVFVDFTLPQQQLAVVQEDLPVRVTVEGSDEALGEGKIVAIDPRIDPVSRAIKTRATVSNREERLRPGMFVNVAIVLPKEARVIIVPATAIVHAAYGDSVFIVEDKKDAEGKVTVGPDGQPVKVVRQQFVRLGDRRGDFVVVVEGVQPGEEVVSAGAFKLRKGMSVAVKPDVKPAPELSPHPENR